MPISTKKSEMPSAGVLFLRDLLTVEEAAERLKLAPKTVRKTVPITPPDSDPRSAFLAHSVGGAG
jgi:hypothetical protein